MKRIKRLIDSKDGAIRGQWMMGKERVGGFNNQRVGGVERKRKPRQSGTLPRLGELMVGY